MKYLKLLGIATVVGMATAALTAGSVSATTLEVGGVPQNKAVQITVSLVPETSTNLSGTGFQFLSNCDSGHLQLTTSSPFTGTQVTGPITSASFSNCAWGPVEFKSLGALYFQWEKDTTAQVFSEGTEASWPYTGLGAYITCKTGAGTKIGTLHGVASGHATLTINAVLNCGFLYPSLRWLGDFNVTSPTGLGAVA